MFGAGHRSFAVLALSGIEGDSGCHEKAIEADSTYSSSLFMFDSITSERNYIFDQTPKGIVIDFQLP